MKVGGGVQKKGLSIGAEPMCRPWWPHEDTGRLGTCMGYISNLSQNLGRLPDCLPAQNWGEKWTCLGQRALCVVHRALPDTFDNRSHSFPWQGETI